ncbi:hypothetical protein KQI52_14685 [bacterium]|nr:hypothetical protein [bacterium]
MIRSIVYFLIVLPFLLLPLLSVALTPDDSPLLYSAQSWVREGEYQKAADAFEKVLEINPRDALSWVFLAQAHAGLGDQLSALNCLEFSVECGTPDSARVMGVEEFEPLLDNERFQALTAKMAEQQRNRPKRIYLPQTRMTWCEVEFPDGYDESSDKTWPLVLYLHGGGRDMDHGREIAEKIGYDAAINVFTDGPYPETRVAGQYRFLPGRFADPDVDKRATELSAGWFGEVARSVMHELPIDPDRVAIIGFSQGAAWTWAAAMEAADVFCCAAPLSGWIPSSHNDSTHVACLADNGVSLFVATGETDRYFTPERVGGYVDLARSATVQVEFRTFDADHELTDEYAAAVGEWLHTQLD